MIMIMIIIIIIIIILLLLLLIIIIIRYNTLKKESYQTGGKLAVNRRSTMTTLLPV